jgi:hypothetical protein
MGVPRWNGKTLGTSPGYTDPNGVYHPVQVNGTPNQFNPTVADAPNGGHGPVGSTIDNASCQVSMSDNYHVHAFVGLYVNGTEYAIPRGIGVVEPKDPNVLSINYATQCFYYVHTHDSTGVVHIEDPNNGLVETPPTSTNYTIQTLFDIWGVTVNQSQFGPFTGPVVVFTSGQQYRGNQNSGTVPETTLTRWFGDPSAVPLYSHEVIWYLVGPTYPQSLPAVHFYEQY